MLVSIELSILSLMTNWFLYTKFNNKSVITPISMHLSRHKLYLEKKKNLKICQIETRYKTQNYIRTDCLKFILIIL